MVETKVVMVCVCCLENSLLESVQFSLSIVWVLGIELGTLGWVASSICLPQIRMFIVQTHVDSQHFFLFHSSFSETEPIQSRLCSNCNVAENSI